MQTPDTTVDALAELGIFVTKETKNEESKEELYSRLKTLEQKIEFLKIQEDYIKDEQKNLKRELIRAKEEVKKSNLFRL